MWGKFIRIGLPIVAIVGVLTMITVATIGANVPVLDTHGVIGNAQRDTLYFATLVMLIIIIPVFILLGTISYRYRETNKKAKYLPDWASSKRLEAIWWGVPIIIIAILSVVTWQTSHSLDPYRPLESAKAPLKVQVVALQWKWLFIYPDHSIASVNEFAMPLNTPVEFTITSDAPMNSFWIPQLGGQVYAMSGMSTKLHLDANEAGEYRGVSANISGEGHADMVFTAKAMDDEDFNAWLQEAKADKDNLTAEKYRTLREPSKAVPVEVYGAVDSGLYDQVIARYSKDHMHGGAH